MRARNFDVVAGLDLGIGPGEAPQQQSTPLVTAYSATALLLPPATLATGMPSRVSVA